MRLWTHLFLLLNHDFFLPLTVDRERAASSQSVIKDSHGFTYRMKKEVRPRNEINIVVIDLSFKELWFVFFFFNLSNPSHCHFTLGFNTAPEVEMAVLLLIDLDTTYPCLARRKMFLLSKRDAGSDFCVFLW